MGTTETDGISCYLPSKKGHHSSSLVLLATLTRQEEHHISILVSAATVPVIKGRAPVRHSSSSVLPTCYLDKKERAPHFTIGLICYRTSRKRKGTTFPAWFHILPVPYLSSKVPVDYHISKLVSAANCHTKDGKTDKD